MSILVTGGAGYIGSVVIEQVVREGHRVVVLDNLSQGHREAIEKEAEFVHADLREAGEVARVLRTHDIEAVIHLAACSLVGQSMTEPAHYFQNNVIGAVNLLNTMLEQGVNKLVFSSSAAVYGRPKRVPIQERQRLDPVNPYGEAKVILEKVMHWYGLAYGFRFVSLRYFNAAGATARRGEDHEPETHLVPNVMRAALGLVPHVTVFGTDYPTDDGTCVRDYIHVLDVARAHVLALRRLEKQTVNKAYNLGTGHGYSVKQVIDMVRAVTGTAIRTEFAPRRPGDPPVLVADPTLAGEELSWKPQHSELETIIESAWRWQKSHPHGYDG